jgi:hypothetical protein
MTGLSADHRSIWLSSFKYFFSFLLFSISSIFIYCLGNLIILSFKTQPITVTVLSKVWNVFSRSNAGIMDSNPTSGMEVYLLSFCVCVVLYR